MQCLKSLLDYQHHAYHGDSIRLFTGTSDAVSWSPLVPIECRSLRGSEMRLDSDSWINASAINPQYDVYLARFRARPGMTGESCVDLSSRHVDPTVVECGGRLSVGRQAGRRCRRSRLLEW